MTGRQNVGETERKRKNTYIETKLQRDKITENQRDRETQSQINRERERDRGGET